MIRRLSILTLFLTICHLSTFSQEIKIQASLDSSMILIGDQVKLLLEAELPSGLDFQFPVPADTISALVEIIDRTAIDTAKLAGNTIKLSQEFIITSFDSGVYVIPPFEFLLTNNGSSDTLSSNPVLLYVFTLPKLDSLINALQAPIDIKPPYEAPVIFKEVAPWIMGTLLVLGLIFLIWYALHRRKNNKPIFFLPQKPKEPAHIIALRELDKLKEEKIWQQGKTKHFYSELTNVLRQYIENRYGIQAMEQTSEETILSLKSANCLPDDLTVNNLKKILSNADLVKFAKYEPFPDENNMALVDSYFFVNQTKINEISETSKPIDDREGEDVIFKS
jgi:hypothetical protein